MPYRLPMTDEQREAKRASDRERLRAKRAAMTPEQRADARRENDRRYRDTHRGERLAYGRTAERKIAASVRDRERRLRKKAEGK